jgi:hypothetical protein
MIGASLKIGLIGSRRPWRVTAGSSIDDGLNGLRSPYKQADSGKRDKAIHAHDQHAQPKTTCLNLTDAEIFRILT